MAHSPNYGPRRDGAVPDIIVLHYTAMPDWCAAHDWLCNPEAEVSAHYIISEAGDVVQMVDESMRAWHAGAGSWGDITDVNSRSIGIELNNTGSAPFAAPLMDALEALLPAITDRWAIRPERVIAHSDLAPGRKIDPGAKFDWARLARSGFGVISSLSSGASSSNDILNEVDERVFRANLSAIGYGADLDTQLLLSAFRLRHRQGHSGALDRLDCAIAADLATRFPIAKFGRTS